jgi:hypothetical protein
MSTMVTTTGRAGYYHLYDHEGTVLVDKKTVTVKLRGSSLLYTYPRFTYNAGSNKSF